uniref:FERM domain-containing protein n=2 Tax=Rhodnius prolixus TaxID=13249 RepID=T1HQR1_RHOPR
MLRNRSPDKYIFLVNYLGGVLTLDESSKITGKELFSNVCKCLGVREYWYFGLQYESLKKEPRWLRPNSKVYRIIRKNNAPLFFLVKYFPEDISTVVDKVSLSLIYNQCKGSIISGGIYCPPETSILLASYSLQSDQGDWAHVDYDSLRLENLLPKTVLEQYTMSRQSWLDSLLGWHKDHEGYTSVESQLEYVRITQQLGMYGVNYFNTTWLGSPAWIGIHPRGINIYQDNMLVPKTGLKWVFIRMVHYTCKKFVVTPVMESASPYIFCMSSLRKTKQVFELAVGYHHLYLRVRSISVINHTPDEFGIRSQEDGEKFKETSEEICENPTAVRLPLKNGNKKISKRIISKNELPVLNEEEEALLM